MRPQLFILTTAFYPHVGGAEMAVQSILPQLTPDCDCVVITARMDAKLPARDMFGYARVIRVGVGVPFLDKVLLVGTAWLHIAREKRKGSPAGMWAIMASYGGAAAVVAQAVLGLRFALTLQEGDDLALIGERVRPVRALFARIFRRAAGIQAIAAFLADWATSFGPLQQTPIVIPNGVSVGGFQIAPQDRAAWRQEMRASLGIPANAPVIYSISRLVPKNGIEDLVDAAKLVPGAHVIIAGDGHLRDALQARASAEVHFVGTCGRAMLLKYAAASDVFCRPALSEGQGIVFLEAMAMGLPVVATNVGGIPETVVPGAGELVPPHAPETLAATLRQVVNDPARAKNMIAAAHAHVQQFDWELLAPKIAEWLQKTLFTA